MIPRQWLAAERLQIGGLHGLDGAPGPQLQLAVAAAQTGGLDRPGPGGVAALGRFKPGVQAGTGPPGGLDHRREAPVAAADEVFDGREPHIGEVGLEAAQLTQGAAQQLLAAAEFLRAHAVPLEGGVGLGREVGDGEVELQPAQIAALLLEGAAGVGNAEHVGVGFAGQADHEVELHLAIAALHGGADASQQLGVGETLVHDVAQALGAGLRRKGEATLAGTAQDVGDVAVETVDPLAGQGEAHVLIRQAVAQLHPHRRQGQVVGAAE